jgi:hypothetical protein
MSLFLIISTCIQAGARIIIRLRTWTPLNVPNNNPNTVPHIDDTVYTNNFLGGRKAKSRPKKREKQATFVIVAIHIHGQIKQYFYPFQSRRAIRPFNLACLPNAIIGK